MGTKFSDIINFFFSLLQSKFFFLNNSALYYCILIDNDVAPSGDHHISKRSSGFDNFMKGFEKGSSFLSTIGKLNGSESIVTTVGGFVGGFFCIFFCNQGYLVWLSFYENYYFNLKEYLK